MQQRLYDFLQWQKAFDKKEEWSFGGECEYEITSRLYPKFEAMCRLEIERWKAVLNTLPKNETALNAGTPTPKIRIASRKKLDVIKVFSAMYDLKWFTDGNHMPLTNKQATDGCHSRNAVRRFQKLQHQPLTGQGQKPRSIPQTFRRPEKSRQKVFGNRVEEGRQVSEILNMVM